MMKSCCSWSRIIDVLQDIDWKIIGCLTGCYVVSNITANYITRCQARCDLEIAELTGKQHKNVMQAIRNMEPAWEKVNGLKFQLVEYKDAKGELA